MLYNNTFSYLINLININKAKKSLYFDIKLTKKTLPLVVTLHALSYIFRYEITTNEENNDKKIRLYLSYYNLKPIGSNFKLFSRPSHRFFISLKALRLINRRNLNSVYLISSSIGTYDHRFCIKKKTGGLVLGFFNI